MKRTWRYTNCELDIDYIAIAEVAIMQTIRLKTHDYITAESKWNGYLKLAYINKTVNSYGSYR